MPNSRAASPASSARAQGRAPQDATLEEMDLLWDEAKAAERKS
jgi:uncharacterized protein YabN with tetrapyrrole methylase and pyrophosphatase domain